MQYYCYARYIECDVIVIVNYIIIIVSLAYLSTPTILFSRDFICNKVRFQAEESMGPVTVL